MTILIWFLTFVLILVCVFLCLLVLVQLPKKEAGLGQAFGSGATDALFGPGSGNMLTKLTKWTSAIFFALVLGIWILYGHNARAKSGDLRDKVSKSEKEEMAPAPKQAPPRLDTNMLKLAETNALGTNMNLLSAPKTNATNTATPPAQK